MVCSFKKRMDFAFKGICQAKALSLLINSAIISLNLSYLIKSVIILCCILVLEHYYPITLYSRLIFHCFIVYSLSCFLCFAYGDTPFTYSMPKRQSQCKKKCIAENNFSISIKYTENNLYICRIK